MSNDKTQSELLQELSLGLVANRCSRETERYFDRESYDPRFCHELFRRAAVDDEQRAWELLFAEYHALAHGWALRHPSFEASGLEAAEIVNVAFSKLWTGIRGEKFAEFGSLAQILQYLRMCVHSVIVDQVRKIRFRQVSLDSEDLDIPLPDTNPGPEDHVDFEAQRNEMWNYVKSCMKSDEEYIVVYESYVLDLRPRQICARHQDIFPDVKDVFRIKQNIMSRFRRDEKMAIFVEIDA